MQTTEQCWSAWLCRRDVTEPKGEAPAPPAPGNPLRLRQQGRGPGSRSTPGSRAGRQDGAGLLQKAEVHGDTQRGRGGTLMLSRAFDWPESACTGPGRADGVDAKQVAAEGKLTDPEPESRP